MSAKDLKAELRELRKSHPDFMPVSKLKKGDVSQQIERLRKTREETVASVAVPSAPIKKSQSAVETIKSAKAKEFPIKPSVATEKKSVAKPAEKKKDSKLAKLMKLMESMSDSE